MDKSKKQRSIEIFNELPNLPPGESFIDKEVLLKWGLTSRALAELDKTY